MADESSSSATLLLAFLSGAVLGAAAVMWLAPEASQEARERLREYANQGRESLRQARDKARRGIDKSREYVQEKGGQAVREVVTAGRAAMQAEKERQAGDIA